MPKLDEAARRILRRARGPVEAAIVCGSGLGDTIAPRVDGVDVPYHRLHVPKTTVAGHRGIARIGSWAGRTVIVFAGRPHFYESQSVRAVTYLVRLAAAAGARTIVLSNAAGAVHPDYVAGDVMVIADHLNLTGVTPLDGRAPQPFLDTNDAYAPRLRAIALADATLRTGVYAGVRGPQYETRAEVEALYRLGADAVGMSTVLETLAARALGLEVLGLSLVTNARNAPAIAHADVLALAAAGADRVAGIVERVLAAM